MVLEPNSALAELVERLESAWLPDVPIDDGSGYYGWEPVRVHNFLAAVQGLPRGSFLDVGCGIGTKMLLAQLLGFDACGVERRPEYANVAMRLTDAPVFLLDAFDFKDYAEFDAIYLTRLCVDDHRQAELEALIEARIRPGAVLVKL